MESNKEPRRLAFMSQRIVHYDLVRPGIIVIDNGLIVEIINGTDEEEIKYFTNEYPEWKLVDYGTAVIMPGIVDSHVHVNEPGRESWEGFYTATEAAAVGGITTIVDMPLNSIPPTTTVPNLMTKAVAAREQIFVDVAFWAGVIPGNERDIRPLIEAGVVGFKCFLCPSGVDEFPQAPFDVVETALKQLMSTEAVLAFHAECEPEDTLIAEGEQSEYDTFLRSRPSSAEIRAIERICELCEKYKVKCHIVHLSAAEALRVIKNTKQSGVPLTVETCPHYLVLSSDEIPANATQFKCCPPIRDKANQDDLWAGIKDGTIDMVVSDHSPSLESMKMSGNFMTAWGGISSLQFGLSLLWTAGKSRGLSLAELSRLLCKGPATLCNLFPRKGSLELGSDADLVIWDPDQSFVVERSIVRHRVKLTPYLGKQLDGRVIATVLRGRYVYENDNLIAEPFGKLLLSQSFLGGC